MPGSFENRIQINPLIENYTETARSFGTVGLTCQLDITGGTMLDARLTASTATVFTMPPVFAGKSFVLQLKQVATGSVGTATFTSVKWNSNGAPTITQTAGKLDILTFLCDGSYWYGSISQGYTA